MISGQGPPDQRNPKYASSEQMSFDFGVVLLGSQTRSRPKRQLNANRSDFVANLGAISEACQRAPKGDNRPT
eukprot:gene20883-biopygen7003